MTAFRAAEGALRVWGALSQPVSNPGSARAFLRAIEGGSESIWLLFPLETGCDSSLALSCSLAEALLWRWPFAASRPGPRGREDAAGSCSVGGHTPRPKGAKGETEAPRHELTGEAVGCHSSEEAVVLQPGLEEGPVPLGEHVSHRPQQVSQPCGMSLPWVAGFWLPPCLLRSVALAPPRPPGCGCLLPSLPPGSLVPQPPTSSPLAWLQKRAQHPRNAGFHVGANSHTASVQKPSLSAAFFFLGFFELQLPGCLKICRHPKTVVSHKLLGFHALPAGMFLLHCKALQVPQTSVALPCRGEETGAGGCHRRHAKGSSLVLFSPLLLLVHSPRGTFVNPRHAFWRGPLHREEAWMSYSLPAGTCCPIPGVLGAIKLSSWP